MAAPSQRRALGASQSRIVVQLVAEALVLGGIATVIGLAAAALALWLLGLAARALDRR